MKPTACFSATSLLSYTLGILAARDGQLTPCFIPLRELAFTESVETITSAATIIEDFSEHANETCLATPASPSETESPTATDILSTTADDTGAEEISASVQSLPVETQSSAVTEGAISTANPPNVEDISVSELSGVNKQSTSTLARETDLLPAQGDSEVTTMSIPIETGMEAEAIASNANETTISETTTTPLPVFTTQITLCIPYCAALDEKDRCVLIKGCRYPEETLGRHGCCPPGHYSGAEVLGLVTFATVVAVFVVFVRG